MKIYLSGKMTGLTKRQILRNFGKAEKKLIKAGFSVMNPSVTYHMKNIKEFSYEEWLKIDFTMLDVCDAIYMLDNYQDSEGAKKELAYAISKGKKVYYGRKRNF